MSAVTVLLVLASACMHALWNAILKRTRSPEAAATGVLAISSACSLGLGLVFRAPIPPLVSVWWCLASGVLEAFYFMSLARALARAPLGPVYTTVRGGSLAIVWPMSILLLGERLSMPVIVGTALVVFGLAVTGWSETDTSVVKKLGWAALTALFVGGYQLAYKVALSTGGTPIGVVAISLFGACGVTFATLGRVRGRAAIDALEAQPIRVGLAGVLASVGFIVFLVAMGRAGAGAAVTLRNTSILFAQVVAFAMGERPKRLGIAGAVLVTIGGLLLAA